VAGAVPGDIADVELRDRRDTAYRGHLAALVRSSPHRVRPQCPHFEQCGGCQWQRLDETAQAEYKAALVGRTLAHGAGGVIDFDAIPLRAVPASDAWGYRTAGTYVPVPDGGATTLGLHAAVGAAHVPIDTCLVQSPALRAAFEEMRRAWGALAARLAAAPGKVRGRQVRIRVGEASREVAIGLIHDGSLTPPAREAIVKVIGAHVTGLVEITARPALPIPRAAGPLGELRWGRGGVVDAMLDRWYHIPVFAPFPATGRTAAGAITSAVEALALDDSTTLLETDAGIGAYTLPAAAAARRVVGRTGAEYLTLARENAAWNEASNAVFIDRRAETLRRVGRSYGPARRALVQLTQSVVPFEPLRRAGVERLVLVATSAAQLAAALAAAAGERFETRAITVVDTHPQTSRAEIQATLESRRGAWAGGWAGTGAVGAQAGDRPL
jgi:23S rRNA (uracil1939-C5)-methyltransferase